MIDRMLMQICRAFHRPEQYTRGLRKAKAHGMAAAEYDDHHVRRKDRPARHVLACSTAFDTIDHAKLLCIVYDLGSSEKNMSAMQ